MARTPMIASRWARRTRDDVLDLVFPPRCGACGGEAPDAAGPVVLCDGCRAELELVEWPVCEKCGAAVPESDGVELACGECDGAKLRFDRTVVLGSYEGLLRLWILRLKADRSRLAGRMLVELAWQRLGGELAALGVDVVTAVPMPLLRRWQRGVNPPGDMAERLARHLAVPAAPRMLRTRNYSPQVELTRSARFRNVAGEMSVRRGYSLQGTHVLLVDDILTTGATASEATRALKKAGAARVTVFVLGRTPAGG